MPSPEPITAALDVPGADPELVHALLTDIAAWRLWSPHVASVVPDHGTVRPGQTVATRAFFSPAVTPMHVDWVRPGEGMGWHSRAAGHRLTYENRVEPLPGGGGTRIAFSARVEGPAAGAVAKLAGPVSRLGMRRRITRLARLALLVQHQAAGGVAGRAGGSGG